MKVAAYCSNTDRFEPIRDVEADQGLRNTKVRRSNANTGSGDASWVPQTWETFRDALIVTELSALSALLSFESSSLT